MKKRAISYKKPMMGLTLSLSLSLFSGCSTVRSVFSSEESTQGAPIQDPFSHNGQSEAANQSSSSPVWNQRIGEDNQNVILRTRRGDRSVEVELPNRDSNISELSFPVSPLIQEGSNDERDGGESSRLDRKPSFSDREITAGLPQSSGPVLEQRAQIESGLNLIPSEEGPHHDKSYLQSMDHLKQLYKSGRFEAALLETDELVRDFPTDPKTYEMRGTLFDRIGKPELALRNWKQSYRFNPKNESLRRFIERKEQTYRGIASP